LSKILKVKTIYFFHGPFHLEYKLKEGVDNYFGVLWRFYFQKLFLFLGDEIWVHSKYMEIEARKIYLSSKIRYINPYVDVNKFVNKLHGVDDKSIKIFTCRRLTPRTGVLELIADLNNSSIINYNLTIAGTGELLPRVKALASSKIMILGYLEDKDLIMEYRKCSLYLLPSINLEGFGYVILEAYAMGKPVVASTSSGGGADFVRQFTPDLLYTVNDPSSLEKAINVAISGKYNASYFKEIAIEYDIKSLAKNYLINSSCGARFHQSA
jgi:glycosyltransferase involved in cell wall biosynthesis